MNIALSSDLIRLRAVEPHDADIIYGWENNPDNWLVSSTLIPFSKYDIEQFVKGDRDIYVTRQLRLMIENMSNHNILGAVDLYDFEPYHRRAGIGILIAGEDNRKQGFASSAIKILTHYAFETLLLKQLYCTIPSNNNASIRLFESLGFVLCAKKSQWLQTKDGWIDELTYQCINSSL